MNSLKKARASLKAAKDAESVCRSAYNKNMKTRTVSEMRKGKMRFMRCLKRARMLSKVATREVGKFATVVKRVRTQMKIVNRLKKVVERERVRGMSRKVGSKGKSRYTTKKVRRTVRVK